MNGTSKIEESMKNWKISVRESCSKFYINKEKQSYFMISTETDFKTTQNAGHAGISFYHVFSLGVLEMYCWSKVSVFFSGGGRLLEI